MTRHADRLGRALWIAAVALSVVQALLPQSAWSTWDAWAVWDFKTRALLENGRGLGGWLHDPAYGFTHPEYPWGWPAAQALFMRLAGGFDTRMARLLSVTFAAAVPPLLAALLAELGVGPGRWLIAGGVAWLPRALDQSANGYVDWPLAAVQTAALLALLRARRGAQPAWTAGALAGVAANLKNEGALFGLGLMAALALSLGRRGTAPRPRAVAGAVLAFLLLALPWRLYAAMTGLRAIDFGLPAVRVLAEFPTRFVAFLAAVGREAFGAGTAGSPPGAAAWLNHQLTSWAGAWFLAAWALVTGWRRLAAPASRAVAVVLAAQLAGAAGAYAVTILDVSWLLAASLDRLMLQWVPAVAALAAAATLGGKMDGKASR